MHWDDDFINEGSIRNLLQINKYSVHRDENVISFKLPWEHKVGEILVSTILLGALLLVSSSYQGSDSNQYMIYTGEFLLYIGYLIYLYRKPIYDLKIDLEQNEISLIPKTEFVKKQIFGFKDITNIAIRTKEVGYQESPFEGYTLYQKSIYAMVGSKKIDLMRFVSKAQNTESEIVHLEDYFKKHLIPN